MTRASGRLMGVHGSGVVQLKVPSSAVVTEVLPRSLPLMAAGDLYQPSCLSEDYNVTCLEWYQMRWLV